MTNSEIDRLGRRLKDSQPDEALIQDLHRFWACFDPTVVNVLEGLDTLSIQSSKRIGKSRPSIASKLRRETIRLSQMQDIAGCRIIVDGLVAQDELMSRIYSAFPTADVQDKRETALHGYRAIHIIAREPRPFEIQVRTVLQHEFAELVEAASTRQKSDLKYGGGASDFYEAVLFVGALFKETEDIQRLKTTSPMPRSVLKEIIQREEKLHQVRARLPEAIEAVMRGVA